MKKIFLLVAFFVLGKICLYAQYPLTQQLGSDSTIVISKGALQSRLINVTYTDTAAANLQRIRQYPGAQIATTTGGLNLWVRNATATGWLPVATGSGSNIYTINGTLLGNRTLTGGGYPLTFTGLDKFVVSADSVRFTTGALNLSLTTDSASITKKLSYAGNYHNDFKQFTLVDKGYVDSVVASSPAGTVTSIATDNGSGITGGTITSTGTLAIDTTNVISTKANVASGLAGKLNISDTAAMLAPYLRAIDTTSLSNRINLKLNISDTASMLGNYLNNVGYGLSKAGQVVSADSATLSNYYLRRKDSLTTTNPLGYVTKQILADTAAAIRSADAGGTVTSVGLTMPAAFNVGNSPITTAGTISVTAAGLVSQYIRGDGTLADFPGGGGGGGASISYYLNGSVNQGTFGGNTYYEMNKTPIFGTGTNFSINADGYIAQFITDAGDPGLLKIPAGNWNFETFFSASSGGGTPTYYVELYKYDGTTFTLIASGSTNPDAITGGTSVEAYFSTLPVPETVLLATDRLAVRIYVTHAGRTITLHTEDNNLCQVITTFTTGITALNGLTEQVQYFTTGTSGTDFNISSSVATHTFNLPTASATNRGALSTTDWTTFNNKVGGSLISGYIPKATGTNTIDTSQLFQSNGNIGIGTTSPTGVGGRILHINAGLDSEIHLTNSMSGSGATDGFSIRASSLNSYIYNYGGGLMEFGTNNTPRMRITNLGQVGIGTGTPDSLLTVSLGTHLQRGIRASGLPQAPGTKALRIDASGTLSYADTLIDAGGTVTSVATNNGTGITGGTITTSGTLAIDTLLISTRAWRQKGIDSVAALVNNNISGTTNFIPRFSSANAIDNSVMRQSGTSIGINTSPAYTLDILETTSATIGAGTANNKIVITGNDNGGSIATTNTTYINFAPFQVEAMRITSSGVVNMGANFANNFNKLNVGGSATIGYTTNVVGPTDGLSVNGSVGIGLNGASTDSALSVLNGVRFQRGVRMSGLPSAVGTKTLRIDASGTVSVADTLTNGISGSGTTNYIPKFTSSSAIGNSVIHESSGGNIGISNTNNTYKLDVSGAGRFGNVSDNTEAILLYDVNTTKTHIGSAFGATFIQNNNYYNGSTYVFDDNTLPSSNITLSGGSFNVQTGAANTNPSTKLTLNVSGNLGLGVTPSAWGSNRSAFQFGALGAVFSDNNVTSEIGANVYISTTPAYAYITSNFATRFAQINGQFQWHQAPSGTAGNNISFTQAMTLDASGNLGVGTTVPGVRLHAEATNSNVAIINVIGTAPNYIFDVRDDGVSKFRVDPSGNVGIGTTNPNAPLSLSGSADVGMRIKAGASALSYIDFDEADSGTPNGSIAYNHGTNAMTFATGGSNGEKMRITSGGNVGIGTTSPTHPLSVQANTGANAISVIGRTSDNTGSIDFFQNNGTSRLMEFGVSPSAAEFYYDANSPMIFYTNGTERMRITSGGNVGIGTTGPSTKLTVYGGYANFTDGTVDIYTGSDGSGGLFGTVSNHYQRFITNNTERMRITSGGNVGIGTTSPTNKLQIASGNIGLDDAWSINFGSGSTYINGTSASNYLLFATNNAERMRITSGGNVDIATPNSSLARLNVANINAGSTTRGLALYNNSSSASVNTGISIEFYPNTGNDDRAAIISSVQDVSGNYADLRFFTAANAASAERMRITSGGNVLVGTTTGDGYKLQIVGASQAAATFGQTYAGVAAYSQWVNSSGAFVMGLDAANGSTERMRITSGGEVYIGNNPADQGAYNLQVNGTGVWGAGAYVDGSDSAVKKNIQPLGSSLDLIKQMNPVTFEYQPFYSKDTTTQTGFIAQELQQVLSDKVYKNGIVKEGGQYLGVAYQHLIPLLVKSIQELEAQVQTLKSQLNNR